MEFCERCFGGFPQRYKGCVGKKPKIPTEAETPPENLTVKQIINMIKAMLKDTLDMVESVYAEEDDVIHVGTQIKLWNVGAGWMCYVKDSGELHQFGAKSAVNWFPLIIQNMARKKLNTWMLQNYYCVS